MLKLNLNGSLGTKKIYVLDTNLFINQPDCFEKFEDNVVVVPFWVIDQLDSFKHETNGKGYNAREASRLLMAKFEGLDGAKMHDGVFLNGSGKIFIKYCDSDGAAKLNLKNEVDDKIILLAYKLKSANKAYKDRIIIVSDDTNVRLKSLALGIDAQAFRKGQVEIEANDFLIKNANVSEAELDGLKKTELKEQISEKLAKKLKPHSNQIFRLMNEEMDKEIFAIYRKNKTENYVFRERNLDSAAKIVGFELKNNEQKMAAFLLNDENIPVVTLFGKTGGGKNLLPAGYGLNELKKEKKSRYQKIIVFRPTHTVDRKDHGAMPGGEKEKLSLWSSTGYDAFTKAAFLQLKDYQKTVNLVQSLISDKKIIVSTHSWVRGRTFDDALIIIDEPQNMTLHEIKTLLTRIGVNSKMVLTGDTSQIDISYVNESSNALSRVLHLFRGEDLFAYVRFVKSERSEEAEKIANIFENE